MAKSWLKALWLVSLSGIATYALYHHSQAISPNQGSKPIRVDRGALSQKSYSHALSSSLAQLGFLLDLSTLPATSRKERLQAVIDRYEVSLSGSETYYLESCFASLDSTTDASQGSEATSLQASLNTCERLLYRGLDHKTSSWRIPVVMGMISALAYRELDKAAAFFNLALSKNQLPDDIAGFPRVESDEPERLAVRIASLIRLAAKDPTIAKYRRTFQHAQRKSTPHADAADPRSPEPRETL